MDGAKPQNGGKEGDSSAAVAGETAGAAGGEHLKMMATVILGMVVKGLDLEKTDLVRLGYGKRPVYQAFRSLRKAKVLKRVTKKNYALRSDVVTAVRKLAEEDIGRPVGWPSIHNFLFVTYGMFDWDEQRMDAFLSFLKKDWLHRMRGSGRLEGQSGGTGGAKREEGEPGKGTCSLKEAAEKLGVAVRTLREWDRRGNKIHFIRLPTGRIRVPESEIERLLAEMGDW